MTFFQGKKTYVVCAIGVLYGVFGYLSGALNPAQAVAAVIVALGGAGFRSALTTELGNVVAGLLPPKPPTAGQ